MKQYQSPFNEPGKRRHVCLLLEGTYPYVSGGVSTWVHQVIEAMPEIDFTVHFIGDQKQHNAVYKYELPKNVVEVSESYLFDPLSAEQQQPGRGSRKTKKKVCAPHADCWRASQG